MSYKDGVGVSQEASKYPRMLNLSQDVEASLLQYLNTEIENALAERQAFIDDLINQQKDYWAKPSTEKVDFPFSGASTIVIPLTAIAVEAIHARNMMTLTNIRQLVHVRSKDSNYEDHALAFGKFLDNELRNSINFKKSVEPTILELEKFGTGIARVDWEQIIKRGVTTIGDKEIEFEVVVKRGPKLYSVPLANFIMPFSYSDVQSAPWCGEIITLTPYELYYHVVSGLFSRESYDKLYHYFTTGGRSSSLINKFKIEKEKEQNTTPSWPKELDILNIWLCYDIDKSGVKKECQLFYHYDSKTLMGVRYNWYPDLRRPYRKGVYFPVEHKWYGIGLCKMNDQFQKEVTTQHRQRIDNASIANMRMFKVSKLSGYTSKEPIFPGKFWFLHDMSHIEPIQAGEVYPSSYNNENQTLIYSQQRTGANELMLGMPQVGTPGTASDILARLKEGQRKFDYVYSNIRDLAGELIMDVVRIIHQFGPRHVDYLNSTKNGQLILELLQVEYDKLTEFVILDILPAGEQENKLIDRNNWTQIALNLTQYFNVIGELAAQIGNPQLSELIIVKGMRAATEATKQFLETFNLPNVDKMIVEELLSESFIAGINGRVRGGNNGPSSIVSEAGVPNLTQNNGENGEGGNASLSQLFQAIRSLRTPGV